MATSSSSAALVALDAGTPARDPILYKAKCALIVGTYEKVAGNTDTDYILLCRVHRDWSVVSIKLNNDTLTSLTDVNIGLVADAPVGNGVTDVDENVYADAVDISSAVAWAEQAFEARDLAKMGQYVWQDAGAATREAAAEWYRIAIHLAAASTATGTISWRIEIALPG
jgi:hypothetical protein